MNKKLFAFGAAAGMFTIVSMIIGMEFGNSSVWLGFLLMIIALSCIFVAIKQKRDQELGGLITFKQAFSTGISIALVATGAYVVLWDIYLHITDFKFLDLYAESLIADARANGADDSAIEQLKQNMSKFSEQYYDPMFRLPMTATEIFPIGALITLVSALILKNHTTH
ncbi:MAG: DUF4199 family protein [Alteromonadaceae bacterium]|nr:DUF4199 family protein [Alteromonadaceae bacterium]